MSTCQPHGRARSKVPLPLGAMMSRTSFHCEPSNSFLNILAGPKSSTNVAKNKIQDLMKLKKK